MSTLLAFCKYCSFAAWGVNWALDRLAWPWLVVAMAAWAGAGWVRAQSDCGIARLVHRFLVFSGILSTTAPFFWLLFGMWEVAATLVTVSVILFMVWMWVDPDQDIY